MAYTNQCNLHPRSKDSFLNSKTLRFLTDNTFVQYNLTDQSYFQNRLTLAILFVYLSVLIRSMVVSQRPHLFSNVE